MKGCFFCLRRIWPWQRWALGEVWPFFRQGFIHVGCVNEYTELINEKREEGEPDV